MTYAPIGWADGSGGGTPIDAANLSHMDAGISAAVRTDGTTPMTATQKVTAPDQLAAGHQETGFCGFYLSTPTASTDYGEPHNFKTVLTNPPTSITINMSIRNNGASTTFADVWSAYGFRLITRAASTATVDVAGTYTTVGNCLLAVDAQAETFDHHCDVCGGVRRALPLSALSLHDSRSGYNGVALAVVCPTCGAVESFNVEMTAADEQDDAPQGSGEYTTTRGAQARLIRQLLTLLELPVA